MNRIDLCEQALRSLGKVHASLSAAQRECPSCGTQRYVMWEEARAKKEIEGAISRITRAKEALKKKS